MAAKLLPELSTALVLLALWLNLMPNWLDVPLEDTVDWLVGIEAATLLLMVALVDIATRMRRPPPWWTGALLVIGLLIAFPEALVLMAAGWELGLWVFLPLLWSVGERLRELWTLPTASTIEKTRRRALSWGRLGSGVVLFGVCVAILLVNGMFADADHDPADLVAQVAPALLVLFYLVCAFDVWRVHRPAFAERPRSLWPFFDDGATAAP